MSLIEKVPPADNREFRQAIYGGAIFHLSCTPASQRLVADVLSLLESELGEGGPIREAQFRLSDEEFFHAIGRLRKVLYQEDRFYGGAREIAAEFGFDPEQNAFDPLRLRVLTHGGHENPRAAPVYYTHRDTWYSHPQCQVSWWIPLHDVTEEETFVFFPEYFQKAVENDSGDFNYDEWIRDRRSLRIGWQDTEAGTRALYPAFLGTLDNPQRLPFSCQRGDLIVFAGSHLHQTIKNTTGRTRFSMDFRTVDLRDHQQGIGAPNADNRSTGSALQDYFLPATASSPQ